MRRTCCRGRKMERFTNSRNRRTGNSPHPAPAENSDGMDAPVAARRAQPTSTPATYRGEAVMCSTPTGVAVVARIWGAPRWEVSDRSVDDYWAVVDGASHAWSARLSGQTMEDAPTPAAIRAPAPGFSTAGSVRAIPTTVTTRPRDSTHPLPSTTVTTNG